MRIGVATVLAVLGLGLLAGCATPAPQNKKVYDRYAALVAERNRTLADPAAAATATPAARAPAARAAPKAPAPAERRPLKTEPPAKPAAPTAEPAKPVAAAAVPEAVAKPAAPEAVAKPAVPEAVAKPAAPVPAPPVQVIAPSPAPKPAPVPEPPVQAVPQSIQPAPGPAIPEAESGAVAPAESGDEVSVANDGVAYLLKPGDVVQIFLRGIPMPEAIESVIDERGMISMPFVDEVLAAGQSASELGRSIRKTYMDEGIYRNISVSVVVPTRYYFIQGEIRAPGRFQMVAAVRVSQAIAAAGGYTEYASGQVVVKRGGKIVKTIRNARRLERTPEDDILLEPDDIIEVKRSLW